MFPRELRTILQNNLDETIFRLNKLLSGQNLGSVKPVLKIGTESSTSSLVSTIEEGTRFAEFRWKNHW